MVTSQASLGADFVEVNRDQLGQLLDQVVNGFDLGVEQLGDFFLEKIRVFDAGAAQFQMDDERGKEGAAPFRVPPDDVQPHPDIVQVAGVADKLPVEVHPFHVRVLEAEEQDLLQENLHQGAVAAVEDFRPDRLDALQVGLGVFLDA